MSLGAGFLVAVFGFVAGFFVHHFWQRRLDRQSLAIARRDLSAVRRDAEFDFFPGTFQYRPIIRALNNNAIDTIFLWHTSSDFGIGGAYTRDGGFTVDEYPLVINHLDVKPESFIALGNAIRDFGLSKSARDA